ncbi:uncharacterized protein NESG_01895 [Nematocida ausubeli]|uniref:Uncharacterized protein n=1 Tax=Nematocida ausubeli (strain ATCC PRA-371 / ERTm2) TaxID=1913371 RepID=A0A086J188_NEMA1|nr:uncharacterized protein NESG_01895 [Nematocida ausubeli]KFG25906.1 hypothetical protein NESG_01895 [Nematocida ausubeli]
MARSELLMPGEAQKEEAVQIEYKINTKKLKKAANAFYISMEGAIKNAKISSAEELLDNLLKKLNSLPITFIEMNISNSRAEKAVKRLLKEKLRESLEIGELHKVASEELNKEIMDEMDSSFLASSKPEKTPRKKSKKTMKETVFKLFEQQAAITVDEAVSLGYKAIAKKVLSQKEVSLAAEKAQNSPIIVIKETAHCYNLFREVGAVSVIIGGIELISLFICLAAYYWGWA